MQARAASRAVFIVCGVITFMVLAIIGAQLRSGRVISALSVVLPSLGLLWLAVLGWQIGRYQAPVEPVKALSERPSKRPPRFEPPGNPRSDRPSDSGRHVSA